MPLVVHLVMERVCVLKNVRIYFKKYDRMKFVSHLDMNRFMSRQLRLSKLPIWYTEGFNPHPYLTFLLPLSLGFESDYEIMDIRLVDDDYPLELVKEKLANVMPDYIDIFDVREPVNKAGKIGYAKYQIMFNSFSEKLPQSLSKFLLSEHIYTEKKGKKGNVKTIDLAPKISDFSLDVLDGELMLSITLPAGGADNINPTLLLSAFGELPYFTVKKLLVYDTEMNKFQ